MSGFHQPRRLGTFRTDESLGPPAAIVSLFEGRDVYGKQSQAGRALMRQHTEVVQGCADSSQEMETESDRVKQPSGHLAFSIRLLMMTRRTKNNQMLAKNVIF